MYYKYQVCRYYDNVVDNYFVHKRVAFVLFIIHIIIDYKLSVRPTCVHICIKIVFV